MSLVVVGVQEASLLCTIQPTAQDHVGQRSLITSWKRGFESQILDLKEFEQICDS